MITFQDHTPNGVASANFGGVIYRLSAIIPEGLPQDKLCHKVYYERPTDKYYTKPVSMQMILEQAKQFGMYFVVNNNTQWFNKNINIDLYGRISGIIADLLEENGFTDKNAAIALMNEPRKFMSEYQYLQYCRRSNDYVYSRFPLILINDEYHHMDEKIIFDQTQGIQKRMFGVHHLSSLGKSPAWQNIRYAKTQANEWKVPIICTEGGSWFKNYQSPEGHKINVKLLEECNKYDYFGCAIVMVDTNEQTKKDKYPPLGYRVWNNDYTKILSQTNWSKFEDELKKYKKGNTMTEERDLRLVMGYMRGKDVTKVQTKLRKIGFDLKVDGWYGEITEATVKKFQELVKLSPNGVVDKNTRNMLEQITVETFYPEVFQDIFISKNYSVEAIDYYLDTFAHPVLKGHGKYFKQAEQETQIPAEWMLGKGTQESSYKGGGIGSSPIAQKYFNLFGWGVPDSGITAEGRFGSFEECILYVPKKIKSLFLSPANWRYKGDNIFGIEVYYSTAPYNAVMKAKYYREICKFLDGGVKHKVPEYVDELLPMLEKYFVRKI